MAVDGSALVAAAVRAACLAKAPRRTVQAVAAAVAGVCLRPVAVEGRKRATVASEPASAHDSSAGDASPEELLEALRSCRREQRRRKKARRKANRAAPTAPAAKGDHADDKMVVGSIVAAPNVRPDTESPVATPRSVGRCELSAQQSGSPVLERPWKLQCTGQQRGGGELDCLEPSPTYDDDPRLNDPSLRRDEDGRFWDMYGFEIVLKDVPVADDSTMTSQSVPVTADGPGKDRHSRRRGRR